MASSPSRAMLVTVGTPSSTAERATSRHEVRGSPGRRRAQRHAPALDRVLDGAQELLGVLLPLDEVLLRSEPGRLEGEGLLPKTAQDHDRHAGRGLADAHDGLRAEGVRQPEIEQDDIKMLVVEKPQGGGESVDAPVLVPVDVSFLEHLVDETRVRRVVLDEKHPDHRGP